MGDYRTTTGEAKPLPLHERRQRRARLTFWTLFGAIAVIALGLLIRVPRVVLASGYVTTEDYAEVRPAVAGTVKDLRVRTGASVRQGDLLVQLDDAEAQAQLEDARSQQRKAEAELARRETEITQLKKQLEEQTAIARLREQTAKTKLDRTEELHRRGLAAAATLDDFRLQHELSKAELQSLLTRDVTIYDRELDVLRHEAASRREQVARADSQVRLRQVTAPITGQVVRFEFAVGELVGPETVLYEVYGGSRQVLKVRVGERFATLVAPGQRYRAKLTSYGGLHRIWFEGRVELLKNVIQTDGDKTYRTAYCEFDAGGRSVPPGTTAEARIYAGRIALWTYLFGL